MNILYNFYIHIIIQSYDRIFKFFLDGSRRVYKVDDIQKEVGSLANTVRTLTNGYEINALALPNGVSSKEYRSYIAKGSYEGKSYENKVVLLVGAEPVYAPNSGKNNLLTLPRVRATGGEKEVTFDLYYWLNVMEKNPKMKYERIS